MNVFIPKADTTKEGILKKILEFKESLAEKSKILTATKFHLTLGALTSSNIFTFLAIACYYIGNDWQLCEESLSFDDTVDHTEVAMDTIEWISSTNLI